MIAVDNLPITPASHVPNPEVDLTSDHEEKIDVSKAEVE